MGRLGQSLERTLPFLLAATVVCFAAGSGSVLEIILAGRKLRWVALVLLVATAAALLVARRPRGFPRGAAAAALLVSLALTSALWSVDPWLTTARAATLALLFAAAGSLATAALGRPELVRALLLGLLSAGAAVALAGLVLLAASRKHAVIEASVSYPLRYRGFGGNPNTVPLLLALVLPVAALVLADARTRASRAAAAALLLLFAGTIVASGSRGALVAGTAGLAVFAWLLIQRPARRAGAVGGIAVAFAIAVVLTQIPQPRPADEPAAGAGARDQDAEAFAPLGEDVGRPRGSLEPYRRSLFTTSGRIGAWRGAVEQAAERPLVGYGFGTEEHVFVDRYHVFFGSRPENSYLGQLLQLGVTGLAVLVALIGVLIAPAPAALKRERPLAACCVGIAVAGLMLAFGQSFLLSVGNIGTIAFWAAVFLVPALAADQA